jgi:hypothetical protein
VLSALEIGRDGRSQLRFIKRKSKARRGSPNVRAGSDLGLEELFEIFEEFVLLGTALHDPNRHIRVTLWLSVLGAAARNRFPGILVHAPAVASRSIALNSLVAPINGAFGEEQLVLRGKLKSKSDISLSTHAFFFQRVLAILDAVDGLLVVVPRAAIRLVLKIQRRLVAESCRKVFS